MRTFYDITHLVQFIELPFDELLVSGIDRCEPPCPVDGISHLPHRNLCFSAEILHKRFRGIEFFKHFTGYAMKFRIHAHGFRIAFCDQFSEPDDRSACCMKRHRKQDISSKHPSVSGYNIADSEGSGVTRM